VIRPLDTVAIDPHGVITRCQRTSHIICRMITNVDYFFGGRVETLCQVLVDQAVRFGCHNIGCTNRVLDQMSQADMLDAGIAITDRAEAEFLLYRQGKTSA
jgi:hypothetical protein